MRVVDTAKKCYLEHQTNDLLTLPTANVGKGGCTIFADMIARHYRWRVYTGLPWCAVFVHAVFLDALGKSKSRELLGKPHAGTRVLLRRMRRKGFLRDRSYTPKSGDLIFLSNDPAGQVGHCGIVDRVAGDTVFSVEGKAVDPSGRFIPQLGGAVSIRDRRLDDPHITYYAQMRY